MEVEDTKMSMHDMTYQVLLLVKSQMHQGISNFSLTIIKKFRSDRGPENYRYFDNLIKNNSMFQRVFS